MEQHDFINIYIKNLVKEVEELSKSKILLAAKEEFKVAEVEELKKKLVDLEERSVVEKDDVAKTWQLALTEKDDEVTKKDEQIAKLQHEVADIRRKLQLEMGRADSMSNKVELLQRELTLAKEEPKKEEPKKKTKKTTDAGLLLEN